MIGTITVFLYDGVCTMTLEGCHVFDGVSSTACVQCPASTACVQWHLSNGICPMILSNDVCLMALVRRDRYDNCFLYDGVCTMTLERWHVFDGMRPIICVDGVR